MRKIIMLEHISLDGVIQGPGGPDEDTSGGFAYGGWSAPYDDDILGAALQKQMSSPFDLLLGRKTFEIWAFWPQHGDVWASLMNPKSDPTLRRYGTDFVQALLKALRSF